MSDFSVIFDAGTSNTTFIYKRSRLSYFYREGIISLITLFVVIGRFTIEPRLTNIPTWNLSYEALAHIAIGYLLGGWFSTRDRLPLYVLIGLTALEVFMFAAQKWMA